MSITDQEYADEYDGLAVLCAGPCGCTGTEGRPCRCRCFGCWHHCGACHCLMRRNAPDWPYFDAEGRPYAQ